MTTNVTNTTTAVRATTDRVIVAVVSVVVMPVLVHVTGLGLAFVLQVAGELDMLGDLLTPAVPGAGWV